MRRKNTLFGQAKGFLNPIEWEEPFGMVMIEAMALGCPVISFARGAAPEIIAEGETGYLVNTVDEMVSAIAKIDLIDREKVRKYIEQNFSSQVMAKNYVKIYKKVIQIQKQKVSALDTATSGRLVEAPTSHSILKVSPKTLIPPTTRG